MWWLPLLVSIDLNAAPAAQTAFTYGWTFTSAAMHLP